MPDASSGECTGYSIARVERSASTSFAAVVKRPNEVQRSQSGRQRVDREQRHERGEGLVQPDAVPPAHRDEVAEPLVGELVRDHVGDVLELGLGRVLGVDEQQRLAVGDEPGVLHRPLREVGQGHEVDLAIGVGDAVVVGEEPQRELAGLEGEPREVALAGQVHDAQRHAVDVERLGQLETAHHERHQVGRHRHRVGEPHPHPAVVGGLAVDLRAVRQRHDALGHHEGDAEDRLEVGLVPARERAAGVGRLELRRRDRVRAVVVGVGRAVEAVQLVVQLAAEAHLERVGAPVPRARRGAAWRAAPRRRARCRRRATSRPPSPRSVASSIASSRAFTIDLVDPLVHLDGHRDRAREGRGVEVGLQHQVVPRRHDGAGKAVAVLHRAADYRATSPDAPGCALRHPALRSQP